MNTTQENAIRFNLESARDRAQSKTVQMRLMLLELVLLWEQGKILGAHSKGAAIVKSKFEAARKFLRDL